MERFRGVFAIPLIPFDDNDEIDFADYEKEIEFCIEAGAHGIVVPILMSEFYTLMEHERKHIAEVTIKKVDKRVPVVIGVSGASSKIAVELSRHACDKGADGVIAMPPYVLCDSLDGVRRYYQAISDAIDIPIFIQNSPPPYGPGMSASSIAQLVSEIPNVDYVKEETVPNGHQISKLIEQGKDAVKGIFGGVGGRYMLDELRRGAAGNMPGCEVVEIQAAVYDKYVAGQEHEARILLNELLPLLNLESLLEVPLAKEVLVKRGIFKSARVRVGAGRELDGFDHYELDRVLEGLKPLLKV